MLNSDTDIAQNSNVDEWVSKQIMTPQHYFNLFYQLIKDTPNNDKPGNADIFAALTRYLNNYPERMKFYEIGIDCLADFIKKLPSESTLKEHAQALLINVTQTIPQNLDKADTKQQTNYFMSILIKDNLTNHRNLQLCAIYNLLQIASTTSHLTEKNIQSLILFVKNHDFQGKRAEQIILLTLKILPYILQEKSDLKLKRLLSFYFSILELDSSTHQFVQTKAVIALNIIGSNTFGMKHIASAENVIALLNLGEKHPGNTPLIAHADELSEKIIACLNKENIPTAPAPSNQSYSAGMFAPKAQRTTSAPRTKSLLNKL